MASIIVPQRAFERLHGIGCRYVSHPLVLDLWASVDVGVVLLPVTVLLISEVMRVDGGRQGGVIAKNPGFGFIQTSVLIVKRRGNIFIE